MTASNPLPLSVSRQGNSALPRSRQEARPTERTRYHEHNVTQKKLSRALLLKRDFDSDSESDQILESETNNNEVQMQERMKQLEAELAIAKEYGGAIHKAKISDNSTGTPSDGRRNRRTHGGGAKRSGKKITTVRSAQRK